MKVEEQHRHSQKKLQAAEKHVQRAKAVKAVASTAAAIFSGFSVIAFPPAIIVLPVILPLVYLVTKGCQWNFEKQVQSEPMQYPSHHSTDQILEREKEKTTFESQLTVLKDIALTMVEFEKAVDSFAEYWSQMEIIITALHGRVDDLRGKKHVRMRLMTIQKDLEVLENKFSNYVLQVIQQQFLDK